MEKEEKKMSENKEIGSDGKSKRLNVAVACAVCVIVHLHEEG